jgi:hypothetical protein
MTGDGWATTFCALVAIAIALFPLSKPRSWLRRLSVTIAALGVVGLASVILGVFPSETSDKPKAADTQIHAPGNSGIITQGQIGSNAVSR